MSENNEIVCRASNWIKIRVVLILLMLAVFAYLFYTDGTTGYKEKNLHYFLHKTFTEVAPKEASSGGYTAETWKAYAEKQVVKYQSEEKPGDEFPVPGHAVEMKWPEELVNGFAFLKEGNSSSESQKPWTEYAGKMRLDEKAPEKPYNKSKVNEQFYFAYGSAGLFVVVLFFFLRTLGRTMKVTDEAYFAPGGKKIPFATMKRIDKRKWDTKGVAVIHYDTGNGMKQTKVDGMIYGQFKKEDGEPAEKLFARILENFKGEVIEYEADEEELEEGKAEVSV